MSTTANYDHAARVGFGVPRYNAYVGWFERDGDPWCREVTEEFGDPFVAKDWATRTLTRLDKAGAPDGFDADGGHWHAFIQTGRWEQAPADERGPFNADWEWDDSGYESAAFVDEDGRVSWDDEEAER